MEEGESRKPYDLEERTHLFAARVRAFLKTLPRTDANVIDGRQLIRSSGSVGANYIEANDAISPKDFLYRIRISRKESNECRWWLRLLDTDGKPRSEQERQLLIQEAIELTKIFSAIMRKGGG